MRELLPSGMDIKVLSSILGHAQASTTLNFYAHALPDHKKESMEKMEKYYEKSLASEYKLASKLASKK